MEKNRQFNKTLLVIAFIAIGGILRMLLTMKFPNFSPLWAMALFAGVYITDKRLAVILPLVVMLLTDVALEAIYQAGWYGFPGFHNMMPFVYFGFILTVVIGMFFRNNVKPLPLAGAGFLSALVFFVVSNFGVWVTGGYEPTLNGLIDCYVKAIPFFGYTLVSTLLFTAIFFGGFEYLKTRYYTASVTR